MKKAAAYPNWKRAAFFAGTVLDQGGGSR